MLELNLNVIFGGGVALLIAGYHFDSTFLCIVGGGLLAFALWLEFF